MKDLAMQRGKKGVLKENVVVISLVPRSQCESDRRNASDTLRPRKLSEWEETLKSFQLELSFRLVVVDVATRKRSPLHNLQFSAGLGK
jgi:hypothetical protein